MRVNFLGVKGTWQEIKNAARTTVGLDKSIKEPDTNWKRRILLAEHSPIRQLFVKWKWIDLKSWISVHFVRHKFGIEHWVKSQRPDRNGVRYNRDDAPQSTLIEHECEANAQAVISISRKRLCKQAMPETRNAWIKVLELIKDNEPELYSVAVPECIYRNGLCPEMHSCGWNKSEDFQKQMRDYVKGLEDQIGKY